MPTSTVLIHRLWASWLWSQVAVEYRSGLNQHYILISGKWFKDEYMIQVKTTKTCKVPCQDFSLQLKHRVSSVLDLMLWGCTTGAVQNKTKKAESRTEGWPAAEIWLWQLHNLDLIVNVLGMRPRNSFLLKLSCVRLWNQTFQDESSQLLIGYVDFNYLKVCEKKVVSKQTYIFHQWCVYHTLGNILLNS